VDVTSFAPRVAGYCTELGASVTSWGRTPAHNAAVGGTPNSRHLAWLAVDVVYDVPQDLETVEAAAKRWDLLVLRESDHDHVYAP